jgi:hypothetical protein
MRTLAVSGLSGSEVARIARAVRYAYRSVIRAFDGTFNLDPAILGKQIIVDELPVTVVGVTPRGFSGVQVESIQEIWLPLAGMLSPPMVVVGVGIGTPLAFWVKSFASTLIQDLPVGGV